MTDEQNVLSHFAKVRLASRERQNELKRLVMERDYLDDEAMNLHPPFFWRAEISNDLLDSHFTRMSESTLQNYAMDAERGVAFLKGHNWHDLPIGYSLSGTYESNGKRRVVADFYTITGMAETEDLITRMKTGLLRDVSVGFHGGRMVCDLCHQDFWDCRHFPGLKYEEKDGDTVRTQLATFTIEDARLSEVSGVFDGSTPEAMILKAQRAAKVGELTERQVEQLEQRYRVKLPSPTTTWNINPSGLYVTTDNTIRLNHSLSTNQLEEEDSMDERDFTRVVDVLVEHKVIPEGERDAVDDTQVAVYVEKLAARVKTLESQADEGRQYRKDLVAEALSEGVRAYGNDFDKDTYEATLNSAPLTTVKRMKADWKRVADAILPAGRATLDDVEETNQPKKPVKNQHVPDSAFA